MLVKDRHIAEEKYPKAIVVPAAIEEIMLFYVKGGNEMKGLLTKDFLTIKRNMAHLV